jgi:hypothetical protein
LDTAVESKLGLLEVAHSIQARRASKGIRCCLQAIALKNCAQTRSSRSRVGLVFCWFLKSIGRNSATSKLVLVDGRAIVFWKKAPAVYPIVAKGFLQDRSISSQSSDDGDMLSAISPIVGLRTVQLSCTASNEIRLILALHGRSCTEFIPYLQCVQTMAKKSPPKNVELDSSNRSSSSSRESQPYSQQPKVLGWLILIAGGFSTWYWYRPLPTAVNETTNSGFSAAWPNPPAGPKSIWSDKGLVVPSLEAPIEVPRFEPRTDLSQELVGARNVTLTLSRERREELSNYLKPDRLPVASVDHHVPATAPLAKPPAPWTSNEARNSSSPNATATSIDRQVPITDTVPTSPFGSAMGTQIAAPKLKESTTQWPDSNYTVGSQPCNELPRSVPTAHAPPLLQTGMRSIHLQDDELQRTVAKPPIENLAPAPNDKREPKYIKQPKRKP